MKPILSFSRAIFGKIIQPHPSIQDPEKRLEAKTVAFMVLVMILGVSLNLLFGSGLTIFTLVVLLFGYIFSRLPTYRIAIYIIIGVLLISTIRSLLTSGEFSNFAIFSNIAWLTLSLVFSSLLLSIRDTILISVFHLAILYSLTVFVPEINFKSIGVSFGYIWVFSTLLIVTKWQRNIIEATRQETIRSQAIHDQLTGLPNRTLFIERLIQNLTRLERNSTVSAILYLDLDNFKDINDEFNHKNGDKVLKVIAERIQSCIRKTDIAARFSGDEFVILLEDIDGADSAGLVAKKLHETISSPIQIQNSEVMVSSSIGIAMIPQDGKDVDELIVNADTAMYVAKSEGKNTFSFYRYEMKEKILKRVKLGKNIRRALEQGEFFLVYQPQYDSSLGRVFGAEALLRWQHPEFGLISPQEFIPIAEKNGMIVPLGAWVFEEVLSYHQNLESALNQKIRISLNLSGRQLKEDKFPQYIGNLISESGVDPRLLELEITENSVFSDLENILSILKEIKSLGVRLAIDDFGTGYSSLSYLERLPFDTIKIDTSFVHKITRPDIHLPILAGIISIATEMGLDVIAEGVETKMQLEYLKSFGCNLIQGHYFNPAFSEQELLETVVDQDGYLLPSMLTYYLTNNG